MSYKNNTNNTDTKFANDSNDTHEMKFVNNLFTIGAKNPEKINSKFYSDSFKFSEDDYVSIYKPITATNYTDRVGKVLSILLSYMSVAVYTQFILVTTKKDVYISKTELPGSEGDRSYKKIITAEQYKILEVASLKNNSSEHKNYHRITVADIDNRISYISKLISETYPKCIKAISKEVFGSTKIFSYNDAEIKLVDFIEGFNQNIFNKKYVDAHSINYSEEIVAKYFTENWTNSSYKKGKSTTQNLFKKICKCLVSKMLKKFEPPHAAFLNKMMQTSFGKLKNFGFTMSVDVNNINAEVVKQLIEYLEALFSQSTISGKYFLIAGISGLAINLGCDSNLIYTDIFKYVTVSKDGNESTIYDKIMMTKNLDEEKISSYSNVSYLPLDKDTIRKAMVLIGEHNHSSNRTLNAYFKGNKEDEATFSRRKMDSTFEKFIVENRMDVIITKSIEFVNKFDESASSKKISEKNRALKRISEIPYIPSEAVFEKLSKEQKKFFTKNVAKDFSDIEPHVGYVQRLVMISGGLFKEKVMVGDKEKPVESNLSPKEMTKIKNAINLFALSSSLNKITSAMSVEEEDESEDEEEVSVSSKSSDRKKKDKKDKKKKKEQEEQEDEASVASTTSTASNESKSSKRRKRAKRAKEAKKQSEQEEQEEEVSSVRSGGSGKSNKSGRSNKSGNSIDKSPVVNNAQIESDDENEE